MISNQSALAVRRVHGGRAPCNAAVRALLQPRRRHGLQADGRPDPRGPLALRPAAARPSDALVPRGVRQLASRPVVQRRRGRVGRAHPPLRREPERAAPARVLLLRCCAGRMPAVQLRQLPSRVLRAVRHAQRLQVPAAGPPRLTARLRVRLVAAAALLLPRAPRARTPGEGSQQQGRHPQADRQAVGGQEAAQLPHRVPGVQAAVSGQPRPPSAGAAALLCAVPGHQRMETPAAGQRRNQALSTACALHSFTADRLPLWSLRSCRRRARRRR